MSDATFNIHEAKTHLSALLVRVEAGEEVIIARAGKPIARLTRLSVGSRRRIRGLDKGLVVIAPNFDDPLPEFEDDYESPTDPLNQAR